MNSGAFPTQPQPQAAAAAPPNNWQSTLSMLANPGHVTTPGATVPQAQSSTGVQPGVLQNFLANWQPQQSGAGSGFTQNFNSILRGLQAQIFLLSPQRIADAGTRAIRYRINVSALLCRKRFAPQSNFSYAAMVVQPPELESALKLLTCHARGCGCSPFVRVRCPRKLLDECGEVFSGKPTREKAIIKIE